MRLVLFDVDGTLLLTGGAGSKALRRALHEIYGLTNGMDSIRPDGKTDPSILREALERSEIGFTGDFLDPLFSHYVTFLREEIGVSQSFLILPGVTQLLSALSRQPGFVLGLATGNIEEGARIKLEYAGLEQYFSFGGYGSDSEDRTELTRIGIRRGLEKMAPAQPEAIFVVGDTPRDIIHGQEAGARTLAVASGTYSLEELQSYGPDMVVASLNPTEPVISFLSA